MSAPSEESLVASKRGKWSQPGVPHKGWSCVEIEDLGAPNDVCEMCESQNIRYVHHMHHPDYQDTLKAGCVCAGHMEEDLSAARQRESTMKSRSGKRQRWLTRKWKTSLKGHPTITTDGYRVTAYKRRNGFGATIVDTSTDTVMHSRRFYPTMDSAKLAAFDFISKLIGKSTG